MRALVLSGGGGHGAFQVGVIKRLTELGRSWDLIAGVSVGSINGTFMAMYKPEDHKKAAIELEAFWHRIKGNKSIYKRWFPFGKISALWKGGAYSTKPLYSMIKESFDAQKLATSGVKLRIGSVAFGSGNYRYVTEIEPNIPDWIMASSAMPGIFPPIELEGDLWFDGGVRDVTPISDVLSEDPDEIDIVLAGTTYGDVKPEDPKRFRNVVNVGTRSLGLLSAEVFVSDLSSVPTVFRSRCKVYASEKPLPYEAFDFSPENINVGIEIGYNSVGTSLK